MLISAILKLHITNSTFVINMFITFYAGNKYVKTFGLLGTKINFIFKLIHTA